MTQIIVHYQFNNHEMNTYVVMSFFSVNLVKSYHVSGYLGNRHSLRYQLFYYAAEPSIIHVPF